MRIGLDFDGVITDSCHMKQEYLKKNYGLELPAHLIKREIMVGRGHLTNEQYDRINHDIAFSEEWAKQMTPLPGMLHYIPKLLDEGHDLCIITNRSQKARDLAESYLRSNGISVPVYGMGKGVSKAPACKGLDVFIDDDLDKLEDLTDIVPNRYLMSWQFNEHHDTKDIATRVHSWEEFYTLIQAIRRKAA
jgi:uncharacterized HAD superfamily protein